jgi:glycosyltransferase involved in cell wall biosynthesis
MPDVSVIIPTRDRWQLLPIALGCALRQVGVSLEVVVVDDGSRRSSPDLEMLRDRRVRLVRHQAPRGVAAARNTGADVATGTWLAWLDDDDLWAPDKLAQQLDVAENATMVYGAAVVVDRNLQSLEREPAPSADRLLAGLVRSSLPASGSNAMARASAVRELGGFDRSLPHLDDWDMWIRLARHGAAARCHGTLVAYLLHGGNRHLGAQDAMAEFDRLTAKHGPWASEEGLSFDRPAFARYAAENLVALGRRETAGRVLFRHGLWPPTARNIKGAVGVLAGPRLIGSYRCLRGRSDPPQEALPWLAALRGDGPLGHPATGPT